MTLMLLLIPSIIVAVFMFFLSRGKIDWRELLAQAGTAILVVTVGFFLGRCGAMRDTEIWNGRIAGKDKGTEHCCHSYPCNCREVCSGSGNSRSCSQVCDTCYLHAYDEYWSAKTTNDELVFRDGCNAPGSKAPARWNAIVMGEPTAVEHGYSNYIKGAPGTLFKRQGLIKKYGNLIPKYPGTFDLYRVNRVIVAGISLEPEKVKEWNDLLDELNASLGKRLQVNAIVVLTSSGNREYLHALEEAWLGGKKNDVVLVVGLPDYPKIAWAGTMSWTKIEDFKLALRDRVEELGTFDGAKVVSIMTEEISDKFVRRPMSDFEYLSSSIEPSGTVLVILFILGLILSGGLGYWFWISDPFERSSWR